jgi:hypothetical protein
MTLNRERLLKIAIATLAVAALLSLLWYVHIRAVYYETLPRAPDKVTGRLYPANFHGFVVYETSEERFRLNAVGYLSEALAFLAVSVGLFSEWRARRAKAGGK